MDTRDELIGSHRGPMFIDNTEEAIRNRGPIKIRGVSYYVIYELPVPWRVIAIGKSNATITHAAPRKVEGEALAQPDERG